MFTINKYIYIITAFLLIIVFQADSLAKPPHGMGAGGQMPPTSVETMKVQYVKQNQEFTVTGSMRASQGVTMRSEVDGRVTDIHFKPGDNVASGAKLIQLNQDILAAQLKQSDAELKLAQQDQVRYSELYKSHAVAKADLDKAVATLHSKEGQKDMIEAQLRQKNIVAPFAGRVGLNLINLGDYVNAGQDLVSLQAIDPLDVEFGVPEVYLNKIAVGNVISLRSDAYPDKSFPGTVYGIDSKVNPNNRTVLVRAKVPNPDGKLLPGVFAKVDLAFAEQKPVLPILQTAIVYEAGDTYVYKIIDGKAVKTKVVLGARDQQNVIVLDGLKADDVIVTAGQLKLSDGVFVVSVK